MTIEEKTNKARRMIEGPNIHLRVNFQNYILIPQKILVVIYHTLN